MNDCPTSLQLLPLHTHTVYSVLDGASTIDEYIKWCKDNNAPGLGLTDHGWVIGALELVEKCNKAGIKPLPGCEFYVAPEADYVFSGRKYDYYHITAWAVSPEGYKNILKLGSISFNETFANGDKRVVTRFKQMKPRITFDELLQYNEGLVLASGCLIGVLNKAYLNGEFTGAERNLLRLLEVYKGRFYIEVMPHACTHDYSRKLKTFIPNECTDFSPEGDLQKACNLKNIELARKFKLPLLITTDSHFVYPEQKAVQDVLLQNGDDDGWRFYNSYYAIGSDAAYRHFRENEFKSDSKHDLEHFFREGVENGYRILDSVQTRIQSLEFRQPEIIIPDALRALPNTTQADQLKVLLLRQIDFHKRMKPEWEPRLAKELKIICDNGIIDFAPYFLFLEKWCRWARDNSILMAPGRGSAAGSLLCYLLKITHINPMPEAYNLPFERFLSMGRLKRSKFPDIDLDSGDRALLVAKLADTYGDRFAQCSTQGTLKIKSAIKDSARVLWAWNTLDEAERTKKIALINAITKLLPPTPTGVKDYDFMMGYTDSDGNIHPGLVETIPALQRFFDEYPAVFEMATKLLGIPRNISRHASSFFISDRAISEDVPTCQVSGVLCTQFTAPYAEKAGLIKFDFLRVNTLADISICIRLVQEKFGYSVKRETVEINGESFETWTGELDAASLPLQDKTILDIYNLPSDPAVFQDFCDGKTENVVFQFTPYMTRYCVSIKPKSIADLSATVALVRPGVASAYIEDGETTMTDAYIGRKNGEMVLTYAHPALEPILKETYGVIVYQEQLQQIFSDLVGYSLEEADAIREMIAKKKKQDMERALPEIRQRLQAKQWTDSQIKLLIDACVASASYSFNKAHSASYAIVAYQCMYLKHHFPLEWWTSVLKNAKVEDIREKGYADAVKDFLQSPHINGPMNSFELKDGKIHAPLYLIDGVGPSVCQAIAQEQKQGPFTSFQDFYDRVNKEAVDKTAFSAMILCGSFSLVCQDDPKALFTQYYSYRRVQSLAIGRGKSGAELNKAVADHVKAGHTIEVPELTLDAVELVLKRLTLLPIYKFNCHTDFRTTLEKHGFLYDKRGLATTVIGINTLVVVTFYPHIQAYVDKFNTNQFGWVGLILDEPEEFSYKDKKTHRTVTALKFKLVNQGDALRCIMWPDTYVLLGKPNSKRLIFAYGIFKDEGSNWSLFVQSFKEL